MFKANCIIRSFANIQPHIKAINDLGINSRNIIFNPRFLFTYTAFLNYTKLLSGKKNPQILTLDHPGSAPMGHYALSQD